LSVTSTATLKSRVRAALATTGLLWLASLAIVAAGPARYLGTGARQLEVGASAPAGSPDAKARPAHGVDAPGAPPLAVPPDLAAFVGQESTTSSGCITCHKETGDPHPGDADRLTCVECHGGNGLATAKEQAHTARPNFPDKWKDSANPHESYTLLNKENWHWIRFVNPTDMRVAPVVCGRCHAKIVNSVQISPMMNSAQVYSTALYNNGSVPFKDAKFAENYTMRGEPQIIHTVPPPTPEETRTKGILPTLYPLPRMEVIQSGTILRVFERGGGPKSELGNPNRDDVPGQPDVFLSNRGFGTQNSVDPVGIGAQKTRLNDPVLAFLGTNDAPGDYRQSGCASCHIVYANDRDPFNSGPYATAGNRGYTQNPDPTIPKNEQGHPIKHEFTRAIPSSQCITCHVHNGNGFLNTYLGYMWWDEQTDGEHLYPKEQHDPTPTELHKAGMFNPEEAAARGLWNDPEFLKTVSEKNPQLKNMQVSDYHGHGWMFQRVYSRDRKGNLLDAQGQKIAYEDPQAWQKAVHLKDIHLERGMHCVDCHFSQDVHGTGKIHGDRRSAIEVGCEDCHGTVKARATLLPSGPAASGQPFLSPSRTTPFGTPRFVRRGTTIIQRSMVTEGVQWTVPQIIDSITPGNPRYSEASRLAKTIQTDGQTWGDGQATNLAHADNRVSCYTCHSSWTTNCFGCHLAARVNTKKPMLHNEGDETQVYASYNPQVLRSDGYMLAVDGTIQGKKIVPARSSSVVSFSVQNGNRAWITNQAPTISAAGFTGNAFNTHPPHTVRTKETKQCTDCHVSTDGDNNAWMASLMMLGSNQVNFMTRYVYVAQDRGGVGAVAVTERDEPQAAYGSHLQSIAYPRNYAAHQARGGRLTEIHNHGGRSNQVQLYGEYLLSAGGSRGFEVFDIANVGNKDYAQRIVTAPFSSQVMKVDTADATGLAIGSSSPLDPKRVQLPENEEQPVAPIFGYAFVSDRVEGLVVIDITTVSDGIPTNNSLARSATFNPGNELAGATSITLGGHYAYITSPNGLIVVDVSKPTTPAIVARLGAPNLNKPTRLAIQFRYAFVLDADGLKVVNVSEPTRPAIVANARVPLAQANGLYLARTYAYIAAGKQGLVIVDIEKPEQPRIDQEFTANGQITDARDVKTGMIATAVIAYIADGPNGLKVVELTSPAAVPTNQGYAPRPAPRLIAHARTRGTAIGISEGYRRDRAVDESGNQLSVFGRRGARPFNLQEMKKLYMKPDGTVWTVTNRPPGPARNPTAASATWLGALWTLISTVGVIGMLVAGGRGRRYR
jgi:hypothetical protein